MSELTPAIANLSDDALQALLKSAIYKTLILGGLASLVLTASSGWGTGALFASGTLVSAASIFEWRRLVRIINSRMRNQAAPRGVGLSIAFILLRLVVFGAVIYGSLKCFRGSPIALVCGLSLAVITLTWEALKLLRG
ncbi:MAG: hypothetical protein WB561_00800 [Terracidiphilus sp.]